MKISLLHIGMMKTASTYMQNAWSRDADTCLAWNGTFTFLQTLRNATAAGELKPDDKLDIQLDKAPAPGQQIIVSNEGFSTAYLNGPRQKQQLIPSFIELASAALGKALPDLDTALILVREPISWIQSMHRQSINEGACGDAREFLAKNRDFLAHSLNLAHLVDSYSNSFPNLLIAPFELLKTDEMGFWNWLEDKAGVSPPANRGSERNASLSEDDAYLLARLNQLSSFKLGCLERSKSYNLPGEKENLIKTARASSPWVNRRFVQFADSEERATAKELMGIGEAPDAFFSFAIDSELRQAIQSNFIGVLRNADDFSNSFTDDYEKRLQEHGAEISSLE